jgi:hypothetical protein
MPKCIACGTELDPLVAVFYHGRCLACHAVKDVKKVPSLMERLKAAGLDVNREMKFKFVYLFFAEADANEAAKRVGDIGFSVTVQQGQYEDPTMKGWFMYVTCRLAPTEEGLSALQTQFGDIADDYENWHFGFRVMLDSAA